MHFTEPRYWSYSVCTRLCTLAHHIYLPYRPWSVLQKFEEAILFKRFYRFNHISLRLMTYNFYMSPKDQGKSTHSFLLIPSFWVGMYWIIVGAKKHDGDFIFNERSLLHIKPFSNWLAFHIRKFFFILLVEDVTRTIEVFQRKSRNQCKSFKHKKCLILVVDIDLLSDPLLPTHKRPNIILK